MKIQGKKGATEGSLWKVITLALIVLVIVIAIFGIMRFGLIDYIKNIPGFGNKSEDKVGRIAPTDSISLSSKEVLNTKSTVDDDGKQRSHLRIVAGNIKINRLLWLTSIFATLDEDTQTYTINPDIFEESYGTKKMYHKYRDNKWIPSVEEMRLINGAKRLGDQIVRYEDPPEVNGENREASFWVELAFPNGVGGITDYLDVRWNFKDKQPEVRIYPNGEAVKYGDGTWIIYDKTEFNEHRVEDFRYNDVSRIKKDMHSSDIFAIRQFLSSQTPDSLAFQIHNYMSKTKRAYLYGDDFGAQYDRELSEINDYLYGKPTAPEP